jgi:phosphoserine phosphatase RsbU/P
MKILIVDDSLDHRLILQTILKSAGYTDVHMAASAREVLSRLGVDDGAPLSTRNLRENVASDGAEDFDLILMDFMMPEMDGTEACRRIKSVERVRDIPIIIVTAKTEPVDLQVAFDSGAMDYITKPVNEVALLARVASALNLKREMDTRKARERELAEKNRDLEQALREVKVLRGFIPICASCKKIRDDKGYWQQIETYIQERSEALFSHGICKDCMKKLYPDFADQ